MIKISKCYEFDIIEYKADQAIIIKYEKKTEKIFDCFLLCTNQINCETTEKVFIEKFNNDYYCGETEYYNWNYYGKKIPKADVNQLREDYYILSFTLVKWSSFFHIKLRQSC